MSICYTQLFDYRCLLVSGPDAGTFLQGQLSIDLDDPGAAAGRLASLNTAQGRVIAMPRALRRDETVILVLPAELAASVAEHLGRYVMRASVTVDTPSELEVIGLVLAPDERPPDLPGLAILDLPADGLAMAIAGLAGAVGSRPDAWRPCTADEWRAAELMAGLPEVYAATAGRFVPQMLNLDLLGGISFTKGCYVGQEVVARAHHLGRIKRRMRLFTGPGGAAQPGDPVHRDARGAGHVVRVAPLDSRRDLVLAAVASGAGPLCLAGDGATLDERPLPYAIPESDAPG